MDYTEEIFSSSIVVVGEFCPAIFTPDWLLLNALIGKDDADSARAGDQGEQIIISSQVSKFSTKWFSIQVLEKQFILTSKDALSPAFKDLAVGVFQLLSHTPVRALGLNFSSHVKFQSRDDYHRVGDNLAPKDTWGSIFPGSTAGLADLTVLIQQGTREKPTVTKDLKRITVRPSDKVKQNGIHVSYNDHRESAISSDDDGSSAIKAARIIDECWEVAWADARRVVSQLFDSLGK